MTVNKVIEYIISAKDKTAGAITSATSRIKSMAASVGTNLMNIKAGLDMAMGAVRTFASVFTAAIKEAFKFERAVTDFKVLLGSIDAAKQHIAELKTFAASTPLTFGDLSQASKLLLSFGADIDKIMPSLKMLGDISMGNAQKFQGLSLAFAQVQSQGKLMGQDLLQMINQGFNPLTIIAQETGKSVSELKDMMSDGAISFEMVAEAMRIATSEGGLFNNAMKESSKTGEGMISTLQDNWTEAVRTFGEAFSDAAKYGIGSMSDALKRLVEDGSVERWANDCVSYIETVATAFSGISSVFETIYKYSGAKDAWNVLQGMFKGLGAGSGAFMGTLNGGGSLGEAWRAFRESGDEAMTTELATDGFYLKNSNVEWARRRGYLLGGTRPSGRKTAAGALASSQGDRVSVRTLSEMMEEASAADDAKAAEKARKAAEKARKEEEKIAKEIAREEERLRKEMERAVAAERKREWKTYVAEATRDLTAMQQAEADAQNRLATAETALSQAWGWYRDKDSLKAQIEEEKANAAAEKQFETDFDRLRRRRSDWRTADNLSLDDEAVRRVGLAREERDAAAEYARETAEASREAADHLAYIQQAMEEGVAE